MTERLFPDRNPPWPFPTIIGEALYQAGVTDRERALAVADVIAKLASENTEWQKEHQPAALEPKIQFPKRMA